MAMLARLALAYYWVSCALAIVFVALALVLFFTARSDAGTLALFGVAMAALTWLAGRAVVFIVVGAER
jgi:hypothetical protein